MSYICNEWNGNVMNEMNEMGRMPTLPPLFFVLYNDRDIYLSVTGGTMNAIYEMEMSRMK